MPLPFILLMKDPNDPGRDLPHCVFVDFNVILVELAPMGVFFSCGYSTRHYAFQEYKELGHLEQKNGHNMKR